MAGGGTGGHLYPALAVAEELRRRRPSGSIVFVGARRGLEQRLVPEAGYPLLALPLAGLKGAGPWGRIRAVVAAGWAVGRCVAWMLRSRPALVVGVGGYASGPAVLAAIVLGIKTMVLEQNHYPGATNRWLARHVDAVCLPSEAARAHVRGRAWVTGNPVRAEFTHIGAPPDDPALSLLVFGGSRGARSINRALVAAIDELGRLDPPPRIVHQTGAGDEAEVRSASSRYHRGLYEVRAFLDDMPARLAAADLVVCRSGASTIAELCAAGRPAILVPYPHAADDHQRRNAAVLEQAGAAVIVEDHELGGQELARRIAELAADPGRRRAMRQAAVTLARLDATARIADIAEQLLAGPTAEPRGREEHVS